MEYLLEENKHSFVYVIPVSSFTGFVSDTYIVVTTFVQPCVLP